jgi:hypothetical protein
MFPKSATKPPLVSEVSVRESHLHLEHRRVKRRRNCRFRAERKALVSCSTLNRQLAAISKELLAQVRVNLLSQPLANPRVGRAHFFVCECAVFGAVCQ